MSSMAQAQHSAASHPFNPGFGLDSRHTVNRANAQHSTGPRTEAGKARVSRNAISHGLYAAGSGAGRRADRGEESRAQRDRMLEQYNAYFQPEEGPEARYVEEFVDLTLRILRAQADREAYEEELWDQPGMDAATVEKAAEILGRRENRLEIRRSRVLRDLAFLTKYRTQRNSQRSRTYDAMPFPTTCSPRPSADEQAEPTEQLDRSVGTESPKVAPERVLRHFQALTNLISPEILNPSSGLGVAEQNKANED